MSSSVLGFGCSAVMGRVGRKAALAALAAAYEAGITLYDTARSYGYGESEGVLGEFLRGRRESVVISTKFGILPTRTSRLKRALMPAVRGLLKLTPGARRMMQKQIAAQFSAGNFSVAALRQSLEGSLRALRTDYVDLLFLHEATVSVMQQEDLFAALERVVAEGKVRRFGIASEPAVVEAAVARGMRTIQFPCNIYDLGMAGRLVAGGEVVAIGNHPFGGGGRIAESKALLTALSQEQSAPGWVREKLRVVDDEALADVVLNMITRDTGIQVVVPSMLQVKHVRANVAAMEHSRFSSEELRWLREAVGKTRPPQGSEIAL